MIVADANLLFALLVEGEGTRAAAEVFSRDPDWVAPLLIRSEVRNILTTMIRRRRIDFNKALLIMDEAERHMDGNEIPVRSADVLSLSERSGCTAYDCEYVSLALSLRIRLVTRDKQVLAAFPETAVSPERFAGG